MLLALDKRLKINFAPIIYSKIRTHFLVLISALAYLRDTQNRSSEARLGVWDDLRLTVDISASHPTPRRDYVKQKIFRSIAWSVMSEPGPGGLRLGANEYLAHQRHGHGLQRRGHRRGEGHGEE